MQTHLESSKPQLIWRNTQILSTWHIFNWELVTIYYFPFMDTNLFKHMSFRVSSKILYLSTQSHPMFLTFNILQISCATLDERQHYRPKWQKLPLRQSSSISHRMTWLNYDTDSILRNKKHLDSSTRLYLAKEPKQLSWNWRQNKKYFCIV